MNAAIFLPTAVLSAGAALAAACPLLPGVRDRQALDATLACWDVGVALACGVDGLSTL